MPGGGDGARGHRGCPRGALPGVEVAGRWQAQAWGGCGGTAWVGGRRGRGGEVGVVGGARGRGVARSWGEGWRAGGKEVGGGGHRRAGAGWVGRHGVVGQVGRRSRKAGEQSAPVGGSPRSSSWTAGSVSPPRTCGSCWWTSPSCSWRGGAAAGAVAAVAGARAPGGGGGSGP